MNERLLGPLIGGGTLLVASGLLYFIATGMGGLEEDLVYYWSPTELIEAGDSAHDSTVRLGGMVDPGTVDWRPDEQLLSFTVSDGAHTIPVSVSGAPPQMFREGIGVVVEGTYDDQGVFHTDRVMVKHSNEYRAPEEGERASDMFESLVVEDS